MIGAAPLSHNNHKKAPHGGTCAPYYDVSKPETVQCNVSQSGLGAALLQDGQPICYASFSFTDMEMRYQQIEKEMLAIVWSCNILTNTCIDATQ